MDDLLLKKIDEYSSLLDRKAELAEITKENNGCIEKCRDALADMMINDETPQVTRGGYSFTLQPKTKWNKSAGKDEDLFFTLRQNGLGDIIVETVNARTLSSTISNLVEENDDELPEEFEGIVNRYDYNDIARRKSNKK